MRQILSSGYYIRMIELLKSYRRSRLRREDMPHSEAMSSTATHASGAPRDAVATTED